ncbi:MAG TPA: IS91 family transposase [Clostridiales bacterium]|nr:IS91 family transposase [Clostridiales bacterium]
MSRGILKTIFQEHWSEFEKTHKVREVVSREVDKMLKCRDIKQGYSEYCCPKCGEYKYVAFTCKSRFCTSCGKKATEDWVERLSKELLNVPHRHIVFTIPEKLRKVFLKDRKLIKVLSDSAAETILSYLWERSKKQRPTPGIVCVVHTFGRDLKWNPHIHALVTEGALRKDKEWKVITFFHFEMLRKRWQHVLLKNLKRKLPKSREVKRMIDAMYREQKEGFYVHAKNRMRDAKGAAQYIGRYVSRPAMAESRIKGYDGENVEFWYERHDNGKRIDVVLPVSDFIGKLIRHIPDRQFKMVRYYGIYSRRRKTRAQVIMSVWKKYRKLQYKKTNWRRNIMKSFGHDPLSCPKCGGEMVLNDIVYKKYGSMLARMKRRMFEAYEKEEKEILKSLGGQGEGGGLSLFGVWSQGNHTRRCS